MKNKQNERGPRGRTGVQFAPLSASEIVPSLVPQWPLRLGVGEEKGAGVVFMRPRGEAGVNHGRLGSVGTWEGAKVALGQADSSRAPAELSTPGVPGLRGDWPGSATLGRR